MQSYLSSSDPHPFLLTSRTLPPPLPISTLHPPHGLLSLVLLQPSCRASPFYNSPAARFPDKCPFCFLLPPQIFYFSLQSKSMCFPQGSQETQLHTSHGETYSSSFNAERSISLSGSTAKQNAPHTNFFLVLETFQ